MLNDYITHDQFNEIMNKLNSFSSLSPAISTQRDSSITARLDELYQKSNEKVDKEEFNKFKEGKLRIKIEFRYYRERIE